MTELARRYVVMPLATDAPFDPSDPEGAFVLKPWKDPAALHALRAYRDRCFPELGRDLEAWIRVIESGPTMRGDVGRRNEPFVRAASAPGVPASAPPAAAEPARRKSAAVGRGRLATVGQRKPAAALETKPAVSTSGTARRKAVRAAAAGTRKAGGATRAATTGRKSAKGGRAPTTPRATESRASRAPAPPPPRGRAPKGSARKRRR